MAKADPARAGLTIRCAIYTRKSSDEGLEQEFNSLDAQREACEAYIVSRVEKTDVCPGTGKEVTMARTRAFTKYCYAGASAGKRWRVTHPMGGLERTLGTF
jgi:hypothetical protein